MQENILRALVTKRLSEISILKGIAFTEIHFKTWTDKILSDYKSGLLSDPQKGFKALETEKCYGGLDYAVFFEGAKFNYNELAEKEWVECLESAKRGGRLQISARAAKVLNSFGGMRWLREGDLAQIQYQKKQFLDTYKNTPEPIDNNFSCLGLETKPYLKGNNNELPALQ